MTKFRKFGPQDKVFAKVRGYPPWPAKVVGIADESPNVSKMKYHILFYGTRETAVVKAEEIFCFFEHRNGKMGKPRKQKGFNEAMLDIEAELTDLEREKLSQMSETTDISETPSRDVSTDEGQSTPRRPSVTGKSKISVSSPPGDTGSPPPTTGALVASTPMVSATEPKTSKPRKRKTESTDSPVLSSSSSAAKKAKNSLQDVGEEDANKPEGLHSRSGRKIKVKKFSDYDDPHNEDESASLKAKPSPTKSEKVKAPAPKKNIDNLVVSENVMEFTCDGEPVKINLKTNYPHLTNPKSELTWKEMVKDYAQTIKEGLLDGSITSDKIAKLMDEFTKGKYIELKKQFDAEEEQFRHLRLEGRMLQIDLRLKTALSLNKAQTEECLKQMDEFLELPLTPLMLKKHPMVVETIKKLRRYIGNASIWSFSEEELNQFNSDSQLIRTKADHLFNKLKSLFLVPQNKSFWSVFTKELEVFHTKTKKLPQEDVFALYKEV